MSDTMITPSPGTPEPAIISRRTAFRAIIAAVIVVVGIVAIRGLEAAMDATFNKPPAPLRISLDRYPSEIGTDVKYSKLGEDQYMNAEAVETLGTPDYLMRTFLEKTPKPTDPHALVSLNMNYYATGVSTPHVPEICWASNGRVEAPNSRVFFDVAGVKHADGTISTLRMRMISFLPPKGAPTQSETGEPIYSNVAYVFQVNGEYVGTPREVMSHFWSAKNKFAYHCKIEVTPLDPADPDHVSVLMCTQAKAQEIISKFIREALPAAEECLPDPKILTQGPAAENAAASQ